MVLVPLGVLGIGVALGLHLGKRARTIVIPVLFGFGLLMGGSAFGFLPHDDFLESATEIGLLLMLFYTSLFGNPRALRDGGRIGLPMAAYDLIVNFAIAWWIGDLLDWGARDRLFLAGIMATSSTAVVLKILGDENRISRREGNVLVSMLLIEDWIFLLFFAFLGLRYGGVPTRSPQEFGLGVLAFVGFLAILRLFRHQVWSLRSREMQIALLTSIGLLGAFLGISAGLPSVGSAFTTGLVLSGEQGARFSQKEAPYLREAASALFFVGYGAMLGPALALSLLPLLGLALGGIIVSQLVVLPVLARRLGLRRSESFITGALLLPRGGKSAAFAKLYPSSGGQPLFALAGLLAIVLTPLTPLVARIGIALSGRRTKLAYASPSESFSRSARSLLMPHAYVARHNSTFVARIVLCELLALAGFLAFLTLAAPRPWNWAAAGFLALTLVGLARSLKHVVTHGPGGPRIRPRSTAGANRAGTAFDHLPILLVAPLALLLLLAVFSPWALVAYPILLGVLWVGALFLPWMRPTTRRAPPLARALGVSGVVK